MKAAHPSKAPSSSKKKGKKLPSKSRNDQLVGTVSSNADKVYRSNKLQEMDLFLTKQLISRRFMLEFPDDYKKLRSLRDYATNYLLDLGVGVHNQTPRLLDLAICTNSYLLLFETTQGRKVIKSRNVDLLKKTLPILRKPEFDIGDDESHCLLDELSKHSDYISNLFDKVNYFDFISLCSSVSYCDAETLLNGYLTSDKNPNKLEPTSSKKFDLIKIRLMNYEPHKNEIDLAFALAEKDRSFYFYSEHIQCLQRTNPDLENDQDIRLVFSFESAPHDIDIALTYLKSVLNERLVKRYGTNLLNAPNYTSYLRTFYMSKAFKQHRLINHYSTIYGLFAGLLMWDKYFLNDMSSNDAGNHVYDFISNIAPDFNTGSNLVSKLYPTVRGYIGLKKKQNSTSSRNPTCLDHVITLRKDLRVGLRPPNHFNKSTQ